MNTHPSQFRWPSVRTLSCLSAACSLLVATACSLDRTPAEPALEIGRAMSDVTDTDSRLLDEDLEQLNQLIPGFGGAFVGGDSVIVFLVSPEAQTSVARAVLISFASQTSGPLQAARTLPLSIRRGRFEFLQLARWRRQFEDAVVPHGVVYTDIDERQNQLVFGVVGSAIGDQVRKFAAGRGIPDSAFATRIVAEPRPAVLLTDHMRPTAGGIQITAPKGQCTLGANVTANASPGSFLLVTASHCSSKMLGADVTQLGYWFQSIPFDSIGAEYSDPGTFTGGACPSLKQCRYSDAALVQYTNENDWGGGSIAFTVSGSLSIDHWVTIDQSLSGGYGGDYTIYRTGTTSGTMGASSLTQNSCLDFYPDSAAYQGVGVTIPSNLVFLCQNWVGIPIYAGDSGGPVFYQPSAQNHAPIVGIAHAGTAYETIYSPIASIQKDLGKLKWSVQ